MKITSTLSLLIVLLLSSCNDNIIFDGISIQASDKWTVSNKASPYFNNLIMSSKSDAKTMISIVSLPQDKMYADINFTLPHLHKVVKDKILTTEKVIEIKSNNIQGYYIVLENPILKELNSEILPQGVNKYQIEGHVLCGKRMLAFAISTDEIKSEITKESLNIIKSMKSNISP